MILLATQSIVDLWITTFNAMYPRFLEYSKASILYVAAAGVMVQVIKSLRS